MDAAGKDSSGSVLGCDSGSVLGGSMTPLEAFKKAGLQASYHFADDSGGEFRMGMDQQKRAEEIFETNPDLQEQMREIAKTFLWSLK